MLIRKKEIGPRTGSNSAKKKGKKKEEENPSIPIPPSVNRQIVNRQSVNERKKNKCTGNLFVASEIVAPSFDHTKIPCDTNSHKHSRLSPLSVLPGPRSKCILYPCIRMPHVFIQEGGGYKANSNKRSQPFSQLRKKKKKERKKKENQPRDKGSL